MLEPDNARDEEQGDKGDLNPHECERTVPYHPVQHYRQKHKRQRIEQQYHIVGINGRVLRTQPQEQQQYTRKALQCHKQQVEAPECPIATQFAEHDHKREEQQQQ